MRLMGHWAVPIAAAMLPVAAQPVELFQLRVGLWQWSWQPPGEAAPVSALECLTLEGLEAMHFFIAANPNCKILPGAKQTRTTYEADANCTEEDGSYQMRLVLVLEAPDSTTFTGTIDFTAQGQSYSSPISGRWLSEACDPAKIPIA